MEFSKTAPTIFEFLKTAPENKTRPFKETDPVFFYAVKQPGTAKPAVCFPVKKWNFTQICGHLSNKLNKLNRLYFLWNHAAFDGLNKNSFFDLWNVSINLFKKGNLKCNLSFVKYRYLPLVFFVENRRKSIYF